MNDGGRGAPRGGTPDSSGPGSGADTEPTGSGAAASSRPTFTCDLCGHVMLDLHCKLVCERCGYKRDCSDP